MEKIKVDSILTNPQNSTEIGLIENEPALDLFKQMFGEENYKKLRHIINQPDNMCFIESFKGLTVLLMKKEGFGIILKIYDFKENQDNILKEYSVNIENEWGKQYGDKFMDKTIKSLFYKGSRPILERMN